MARVRGVWYCFIPIFSACVWTAMLLALLITWIIDGRPRLRSMEQGQTVAYISDIGAERLKPLFIAMGTVTVVTFDAAILLQRILRDRGSLTQNTSIIQKILSWFSVFAAVVAGAGLILLSIFDTLVYRRLHNIFLAIFIVGYIVSAIATCAEYQRLGIHFREHAILRISFWVKLIFILIEIALAVVFGVSQRQDRYDLAAIVEWIIAFIFTFYILSFFPDFLPATRSKHRDSAETHMEMATDGPRQFTDDGTGGRYYGHDHSLGYANGDTSSYTNSHAPSEPPKPEYVPASRNF